MIGTTMVGRYRVDAQLGVGGMGVVYRAHDLRLKRDVALKVIAPHLMGEEAARERFLREAEALAGLTHPNIVTIFDLAQDSETDTVFIVMELLEGLSLRQALHRMDRPPFRIVAIQVCRALEAAHARGVLHRDIKPENIYVCTSGTIKLMDFGLARLLASTTKSQSSVIVGTMSYMAPEQLRGEPLDARSDLYALGVLFYEYLSGAPPFTGDNPGTVLFKHLTEAPAPLSTHVPTIPPELEAIVMRLLEKEPSARFASAQELRVQLGQVLFGDEASQRFFADDLVPPPAEYLAAVRTGSGNQPHVHETTLLDTPQTATSTISHPETVQAAVDARSTRRWPLVLFAGAVTLLLGLAATFALGSFLFPNHKMPRPEDRHGNLAFADRSDIHAANTNQATPDLTHAPIPATSDPNSAAPKQNITSDHKENHKEGDKSVIQPSTQTATQTGVSGQTGNPDGSLPNPIVVDQEILNKLNTMQAKIDRLEREKSEAVRQANALKSNQNSHSTPKSGSKNVTHPVPDHQPFAGVSSASTSLLPHPKVSDPSPFDADSRPARPLGLRTESRNRFQIKIKNMRSDGAIQVALNNQSACYIYFYAEQNGHPAVKLSNSREHIPVAQQPFSNTVDLTLPNPINRGDRLLIVSTQHPIHSPPTSLTLPAWPGPPPGRNAQNSPLDRQLYTQALHLYQDQIASMILQPSSKMANGLNLHDVLIRTVPLKR